MVKKLEKEDFFDMLKKESTAVISMNNGMMTTRTVSIMFHDNKIWFQTDLRSKKMDGLNKHDKCSCSLMVGGINIDGAVLETKGHPLDECNREWLCEFEKKHPNTVRKYSDINTEVLCCINIMSVKEIRMWEYDDMNNPYIHQIRILGHDNWEDKIVDAYTYQS